MPKIEKLSYIVMFLIFFNLQNSRLEFHKYKYFHIFFADLEKENKECKCTGCVTKRELLKNAEPWRGPKSFVIKLVIIFGWVILILLAYRVSQFDYEMANFDPYEILGIPLGASQTEIKKAYRKLSLILHPDKDTGDEKAFMKLSKAYQV